MEGLIGLYARRKLQVNPAKSAVAPAGDRTFLGFRLWEVIRGRTVHRRLVAPEAMEKMKARVRELTSSSRGWSVPAVVSALHRYLLGWRAYFRLAETPSTFGKLDGWIRRRLRLLIIIQCKRGTTLFRHLRARGLSIRNAAGAAAYCRRWWSTAASPALNMAYPPAYFDQLGLPRVAPV
jgi:RNA-directed DNA polymerase